MPRSIFFSRKYTIADTAKPLETADVMLVNADLQVSTNAVDIGDFASQDFELSVGDIDSYVSTTPLNLSEYFAKNHTGGNAGYLIVKGLQVFDHKAS